MIILSAIARKGSGQASPQSTQHIKPNGTAVRTIDVDLLNPAKVKTYPSLEHQTFHHAGQQETLRITPQVNSVLKAVKLTRAKTDFDGDKVYSDLKIIAGHKVLFQKRGVLGVKAFEINKARNLLSFSMITEHTGNMLLTMSNLILIDLNSGKVSNLKSNLSNTINAPFSADGNTLYYLNHYSLYKINLTNGITVKTASLKNRQYIPLHITLLGNHRFNLSFIKDTQDQQVYSVRFAD